MNERAHSELEKAENALDQALAALNQEENGSCSLTLRCHQLFEQVRGLKRHVEVQSEIDRLHKDEHDPSRAYKEHVESQDAE